MKEKTFQQAVVTLAKLNGWLCYHSYDSRKSEPGFPDLVLVHPRGQCLFVELKSETGKITKAQGAWLEALLGIKGRPRTYLWRPADWHSGLIESLLRHRPWVDDTPPADGAGEAAQGGRDAAHDGS